MLELDLERPAADGLFLERLDAFMDKSIADIRAFAERESRPFEETRQFVAEWHARYVLQPRDSPYAEHSERSDKIRTTLHDASRILESLSETSGVQSFILAVNPADLTNVGFLGGSVIGREFWRHMRNGGETGAKAFKAYCTKKAPSVQTRPEQEWSTDIAAGADAETTGKRTTAKNVKSELYEKTRTALRRVSGVQNAEMRWTNPERLDVYGVRLVGWPSGVPAQNPSSLKQNQNKLLLQAMDNGSLRFERIPVPDSEDPMLESVAQESTVDLEEDSSWPYCVGSGPTAHNNNSSLESALLDESNFDYGEYLNSAFDDDTQPPPIKRARTEEID
ncbi:hypothetical protein APHAL10511_007726 [Amanita phalloides]|nr:hypothetical protein APHAL10511_007726 [Amanita phalloides]